MVSKEDIRSAVETAKHEALLDRTTPERVAEVMQQKIYAFLNI